MKSKSILIDIINWFGAALYLAAGITVLIFKFTSNGYDALILGSILLITGITRIVVYFLASFLREPNDMSLVTGTVITALGFIFLFSGYDIDTLCFGWGVLEIVSSGVEIYQKARAIREHKIAILETAISIGALVFGILLCIKTSGGLNGHLIYLGISLILLAIYQGLNITLGMHRRKKVQQEEIKKE